MTAEVPRLSALRLQIMWTRLIALVEEQAQTLLRTAFSPIVRESGDLSAGIFDPSGRMLAQAVTGTPGHINTMARSVSAFLTRYPTQTMQEGDVYVTNDPWHGTGHLHDYVVVTPAFHRGKLVALFGCTGHMTDVGGIGLTPEGLDLFMEGVAIPIMKLVDRGRINETLIAIATANSRMPAELEGDVYSLIASNDAAIRRLRELLEEVDSADIEALADYIVDRSRRAVVERIRALPKGEAVHRMTIDGFEAPIELVAALRVLDDCIEIRWDGTSAASKFGINVPFNYGAAYVSYALACAVAPDVPNNEGSLSAYRMRVPEACILNARRPQPVSCRHIVGGLLPDVVLGCFDRLVPGRTPAESASALWTLTIKGGAADHRGFMISIVTNGGTGARPGADGLSATSFPSAVRGTPVEIVEQATPLVFWRRELRAGSGGAGKFRGGLGQEMEIGTRDGQPFTLYAAFDRIEHPARGRAGAGDGAAGELMRSDGVRLAGKGAQRLEPHERLIVRTPGGGGYGNAAERSVAAEKLDRTRGYISTSSTDRGGPHESKR
ncbi:MAG: hydantoinase B/oxoprolinase family protein [Burkholderiales bacterium]